jgi:hypothetical protein
MPGCHPSTIKSSRKPEIGLFLLDYKEDCSIYSARKDHIHAVLGIDFFVYRSRYCELTERPFETIQYE